MDEPYRSTVLLRFFGDQSLAQIARQQGVPLDTVKTRLRRAIEQLRERLDHLYGGREAWTLGILSLVGGMAALSSPPAVASTTTAHAAGLASTGGASSAATIANISLGGFVVSQKTVLTLGLIGIITLTGGYGLGRLASNPNAEDARTRLALAEARLKKDIAELKAEKEKHSLLRRRASRRRTRS